MPPADLSVHNHRPAQTAPAGGILARHDVLFTNERGEENRSLHKRKEQALQKLRPPLQRLLARDESVLAVFSARSPLSLLEQLTAAWWTAALAACRIVVTNKRILFFPAKRDGSWRESVRAVQWGDLEEVKPTGFIGRNVRFTFKNGGKITYTNFSRGDAKKLAAIARAFLPAAAGELSSTQNLIQICPDCCNVLTSGQYSCAHCGLIFKNERSMATRSIFLPGGGYFYTGHPLVAMIPAVVEGLLLVEIFSLVYLASSTHRATPILSALLALLLVWILETAITILHCRRYVRDFIPERRDPSRAYQVPPAKIGA